MGNSLRLRINGNDGHKPKTKKENHIMKSRKNILTSIVAVLAILVTSANSSPAAPERCDGTVQLTSQSNFQVRQAGSQTFVEFDFTGLHDHLPGRPLGRDRHRRRPPGPAHFGQR